VAGFFTRGILLIFGINALHNVVHLATGVLGLAAGFSAGGQWARQYNQVFGVVYLLVTALGFAAPALTARLLAINPADNFLHLALGIVLTVVGFGVSSKTMATSGPDLRRR
jgi:glucose uptake protein GlcU